MRTGQRVSSVIVRTMVGVVMTLGAIGLSASCSGTSNSASPVPEITVPEITVPEISVADDLATNPFIPDDVNIGDCVSSLPRPECGTDAGTSGKTTLTFAVLMLGMAFIFWRVFRGVRQRDAGE